MAAPEHIDSLQRYLEVRHGQFREAADVNLCAVVRDEMFLMPAFFEHYRRLGVEQFIILDDGSEDGTLDFLCNQADCLVLSSRLRYGQPISVTYPDGSVTEKSRAGPILRSVIHRAFLKQQYAVSVDADEFLILPDGYSNLAQVFLALAANDIRSVAANLVEFYPKSFRDLEGAANPRSFADLVALYPYFDAVPLLEMRRGKRPKTIAASFTYRFFEAHKPKATGLLPLRRSGTVFAKPRKFPSAGKNPILWWDDDVWMRGSHGSNVIPTTRALLVLAHFKLTHDFVQKVQRAVHWNSHFRNAERYHVFHSMLKRTQQQGTGFFGDTTESYSGPAQLARCGLLKWELSASSVSHARVLGPLGPNEAR